MNTQPSNATIITLTEMMFETTSMYHWLHDKESITIDSLRVKCKEWLSNETSWRIPGSSRYMTKIVYTLLSRCIGTPIASKFSVGAWDGERANTLLRKPPVETPPWGSNNPCLEIVLNKPEECSIMSQPIYQAPAAPIASPDFEVRYFIKGGDVRCMSPETIVAHIKNLERDIEGLEEVSVGSKAIRKMIKNKKKALVQMVAYLDGDLS